MTLTTFPIDTVYQDQTAFNVVNVTDPAYGATGDGSTDDSGAIQSAITAALASGGPKIVYFPPPSVYYKCDSPLDLTSTVGLTLLGSGSRVEPVQDVVPVPIVYSGTAAVFVDCGKSHGLTLSGLGFQVSNASFTGDIISTDFTGGGVTYSFKINDCVIGGYVIAARNARSGLCLAGLVEGHISRNCFGWSDYGIIGVVSGATAFSTVALIQGNRFTNQNQYAIAPMGGAQWVITENVFEPGYTSNPNAAGGQAAGIKTEVLGGGGASNGIIITNNGFWDAENGGTWIDILCSAAVITGNLFSIGSSAVGIAFKNGGVGNIVSGNRVMGTTGSTFITVTLAYQTDFYYANNVLDGGIIANGNPANVFGSNMLLGDVTATGVGVGVSPSVGQYQARQVVGAGAVGGNIILDRNDSTNWRGAALFSYFDSGLSKDGLAIGVANSTTAPNTTGNIKVFIDEVGAIRNGGDARFIGYTSSTAAPTTSELPHSKDWCFHNDTTGPTIYLAFNIGGAIKKLTLT